MWYKFRVQANAELANVNVTQNSERCIRMVIQQFKDITTSLQTSSKICDQKNKPNSLQKVILSIGSKGLPYQLRSKSRLQPSNGIILCSAILFNNTQFWNDDMWWNWMYSFFSSSDSLSLFRNNYRFDIVSDKRLCSSSYHNMFWCLTSCSRDGFIKKPQDNGLYKE